MPTFGNTLFSELNGPKALVDQAVASEQAGFDFVVMSDHFHPWLSSHTDSPFAWSVLGAVADRTEHVDLMTYVTCPFIRYHPAIIAQAAATLQLLSDLPNVVNFDAAASTVRDEDLAEVAGIGPDPDAHANAIMAFVEAGYDEICVVQVGDDKDGFFRLWTDELAPRLAKVTH